MTSRQGCLGWALRGLEETSKIHLPQQQTLTFCCAFVALITRINKYSDCPSGSHSPLQDCGPVRTCLKATPKPLGTPLLRQGPDTAEDPTMSSSTLAPGAAGQEESEYCLSHLQRSPEFLVLPGCIIYFWRWTGLGEKAPKAQSKFNISW